MNKKITLRPVEDADLPLLEAWLRQERILKWYHDADEWLGEIRARHGAFAFLHHYMVLAEGLPIGFGQWYDCFDAREEWYTVERPGELFSIDYLIGNEDYLGRGYGKAIVRALIARIRRQQPAARIVAQPELENTPSCKALLANGFTYDTEREYYTLNT